MNYEQVLSDRALAARTSPIDELFKTITQKPDIISFAAGAPDTSLLPVEMLDSLNKRAVERYGRSVLQYGLTQGFAPLRQAVLPLLTKRGIRCTAADVHIGTGGCGVLNNICMALLNKGDTVLVEAPTYSPAVKDFLAYETNVVDVAMDNEGMSPPALEQALKRQKVKLIYLLPTFQNPTGRTMSPTRRELAKKYRTLIIEDDVYYDLRYQGQPIPALYSFAPENTLYFSSLSKIFAPAARVGIAVMPAAILEKVLILKQGIDMQTSSYTQALATEFLNSDYSAEHLRRINQAYGDKLRIMCEALETHLSKKFIWSRPEGGMFVWITGPSDFDADALLPKAIEAGVAFVPGSAFYARAKTGRNTLRLSFANPKQELIAAGIETLAKLCNAADHG